MADRFKVPASFTVEATFIIPLLFFLLLTVTRYSFLLHDAIIADAWAAYTAEEARMAMQYGRVPYGDGINSDGFNDEKGREKIEKILDGHGSEIKSRMMFADVTANAREPQKDEVSAYVSIKPGKVYGMLSEKLFLPVKTENVRSVGDPAAKARLACLVFRAGKKILGV